MIMRHSLISKIAAALALTAAVAGAASADDGAAAVADLASASSPRIKASAERLERARAEADGARSDGLPNIYFGAGALWNDDDVRTAAFDPRSGMSIGVTPLVYRNTYVAGIGFVQVLWSGGSVEAKARAARLHERAARAEHVRVYQLVRGAAREAWYACGRARAHLEVAREAESLSREHLKRAEALHAAGLVPNGDVLRVKVAVSQAELDVIRAESAIANAWAALESIVGATVPHELFDSSSAPSPDMPALSVSAEEAAEARPELSVCRHELDRARELIKAASGQRLPTVAAAGEAIAAGKDFLPNDEHSWHVQLGLKWTLYDGGEIRSKERAAAAAARELVHSMDDLKATVRREVVQAENDLRSAVKRLAAANAQLATAEEDHRIALRRYDAQVGTNIDVLDARMALTASRTAQVDALYDVAAAKNAMIIAAAADTPPEDGAK